jgi:hypothetical protein
MLTDTPHHTPHACREAAVQQMTLNSSMRTLTQQQQQQLQHSRPSPAAGGGSAVGQLLSKATVMDAIKQVWGEIAE